MRILHVIGTLNPAWGGPVEGLRNITSQAMLRGHDVSIATLDHPDSRWLSSWKPKLYAIGNGRSLKERYRYTPSMDNWLLANLNQFDRVIVHSIWMYHSLAVWKATRKVKVPYYLFIHGALDPWFKRRYPMKDIKKLLYWKLFEHKVVRDAEAVLFTTEEEMLLANNAYLPYRCRPAVIGYGISPPVLNQRFGKHEFLAELTRSHPVLRNRKFILLLARVHEKKGVDLLLNAFALSRDILPDHALIIAGPGEDKYLLRLKELARSLGVDNDVFWIGPQYGESKQNLMRAAEVYMLPSHQENFGLSVVEALACGTPVLISNKVNIWREVESCGAGLVAPDDQEGANRLLRAWSSLTVSEKAQMNTSARRCFEQNFDMSVACERLFDVVLTARHAATSAG